MSLLITWLGLGKNVQRMRVATSNWVRAPSQKAPTMPVIANTISVMPEMRVKIHIAKSRLKPTWTTVLVLICLTFPSATAYGAHNHDKYSQTVYNDENHPLQPGDFMLILYEPRPRIQDDDPQTV